MNRWIGMHSRNRELFRIKSQFNDIVVTRNGNLITLWSPKHIKQSELDLRHPLRPYMEYHRHLLLCLLFCPSPRNILAFGLGGGVVPNILHNVCPETSVDIVEIDPEIPPIAERFFHFKVSDTMKVILEDAFVYLHENDTVYDVIVWDTYFGDQLPVTVDNSMFLKDCAAHLSPRGVLAANLMTGDKEKLHQRLKRMNSIFPHLWLLPGEKKGNMIVFAGHNLPSVDSLKHDVDEIKRKFPFKMNTGLLVERLLPYR